MSTRKVKVMEVTPEVATRWLNESNLHNRPLRNQVVRRYANAMASGHWKLTAEPVAFSRPYTDSEHTQLGVTLLNGQHRLWAVVESGKTVMMTVWFGCEPDEFEVIDQGALRTAGDILATTRTDLKDPTRTARVAKAFLYYGLNIGRGGSSVVTVATIAHVNLALMALGEEIESVTQYAKGLGKLGTRPMLSCLVLTRAINPGMADLIAEQMHTAIGFTEHDPIRALHNYVTDRVLSPTKDSEEMMHCKVAHALCARLRGERLKTLRVTTEGIGWLRDACRGKIDPLVQQIFGRVPDHFYKPRNLFADAAA